MSRNWVSFTLAAIKPVYTETGLDTALLSSALIPDRPEPFSVRLPCVNWVVRGVDQINNLEPAGIR
jgi:hypothetical protein